MKESSCNGVLALCRGRLRPPHLQDRTGEENIRNYLRRWLRVSDLCREIVKRYEGNLTGDLDGGNGSVLLIYKGRLVVYHHRIAPVSELEY